MEISKSRFNLAQPRVSGKKTQHTVLRNKQIPYTLTTTVVLTKSSIVKNIQLTDKTDFRFDNC